MTSAVTGFKALLDGIATSPVSTFTTFLGPRRTPQPATGKTAGRFAFVGELTGTEGVRGAHDGVTTAVGEIGLVLWMPLAAVETDSDHAVPLVAARQVYAAALAASPSREYTSSGRRYRLDTDWRFTRSLGRPAWSPEADHYVVSAVFGVEYLGGTT